MNSIFYRNARARVVAIALLIATLAVAPVSAFQTPGAAAQKTATLTAAEREAVARVKTETITEVTNALTAKEMEGRGTATAGGERAAHYLADRFAKMGLKPLGDNGTYLQAVKFKTSQYLPATSITAGDLKLEFGRDYVVAPSMTKADLDLTADVVFIGYGVADAELKHDDLAGLDLKGKVVVVIQGRPKNIDTAVWQKAVPPSKVFFELVNRGVAGFIITNLDAVGQSFANIAKYTSRRRVSLAEPAKPEETSKVPPIFIAGNAGVEKLFSGLDITLAQAIEKAERGEIGSRELKKNVTFTVRKKVLEETGSNVVGVLEGADDKLKDQAVIYSAHYDAFGITNDGTIFPGAADNALGVAMMVSIADALVKQRPRSSVIFIAVTGEEFGLLGAKYWVEHPTWPIEKLSADINFDGIGTETYGPVKHIVGFGQEHSSLGPIMEDVGSAFGLTVNPDPFPEEQVFYRSDHFAFVRRGVPALMMLGGPDDWQSALVRAHKWLETDYHESTDTVRSDWNWEGPRTLATVGLVIGMRVANNDTAPNWLTSSPFNHPRGTDLKKSADQD